MKLTASCREIELMLQIPIFLHETLATVTHLISLERRILLCRLLFTVLTVNKKFRLIKYEGPALR
jgi:hypothetical protein